MRDALMQEHNLTRAGRRLGLSQPATSHALSGLRQMLKDDLFIRSPDGMQPTPRAQQMAAPIRDALRVLRLTLEPEDFDPAQSSRGFTLVVNNYAARAVVPALARKVGEIAPNVTLDIRPTGMIDVLDQLAAGGVARRAAASLQAARRQRHRHGRAHQGGAAGVGGADPVRRARLHHRRPHADHPRLDQRG
jgi:DNA-binding transcriptional LysR family regulator